ncbi:MAG: hypothetical protein ACI8S6_003132 [Myxococcota bacterium]|jgi:hypothetical protein
MVSRFFFAALLVGCSDFELVQKDDTNFSSPDILVDPLELYFGVLAEGESSQNTLNIKNQGDAALEVAQVLIISDGAFTVLNAGFPLTMQPEDELDLILNYTSLTESDQGTATIISNDPDQPAIDVALYGGYVGPKLEIYPPAYNFEKRMTDCEDTTIFELRNVGSETLSLYDVTMPGGEFEIVEEPSRWELAPGQATAVEVRFEPFASRLYEDALTVDSNDPEGVQTADVYGVGSDNGFCQSIDLTFEVEYEIADIGFLLDTTCSMSGLATAVAADFSDIATSLYEEIDDITFGVATFRDYNYGSFGAAPDLPFILETQQTTSLDRVRGELGRLSIGGGSDGPESSMEAIYQAASGRGYDQGCDGYYDSDTDVLPFNRDPSDAFSGNESGTSSSAVEGSGDLGGMGFREDVLSIIIFGTDNDLRDPDKGDPSPGGCDDAGSDDVRDALDAIDAKLIGVGVGFSTTSPYYTEMADISDYVVTWNSGSSSFQDTIVTAVEELINDARFDEVWLELISDDYNAVDSLNPDHWTDVPSGNEVTFTIETVSGVPLIIVPNDTSDDVIVEVYGSIGKRTWLLNTHTFYVDISELIGG